MEEKSKLIRLSSKSWHYKLTKYTFRKLLPNPKQLKNLCSYFWMLVASILLFPIYAPIRFVWDSFKFLLNLVDKFLEKYTDGLIDKWLNKLDAVSAINLYEYSCYDFLERPSFIRKKYDSDLLHKWALKLGIDTHTADGRDALDKYFKQYYQEYYAKCQQLIDEKNKKQQRVRDKELRDKKIKDQMNAILNPLFNVVDLIRDAFSFTSYNQVIKTVKKVVGLLITGVIATGVYFIVQTVSYLILSVVAIWNTSAVLATLLAMLPYAIVLVIGLFLGYLIIKALGYIIYKYECSDNLSIWLKILIYPAIGIYNVGLYGLWYPLFFIFISFLYKFIIMSVIVGIFRGFLKGLLGFGGIFGEYFSSSFNDTCPGIEWEDEK